MAGKFPVNDPKIGADVVDEDMSNEDPTSIQEFEDFKVWIEKVNSETASASAMPPPPSPQICKTCGFAKCALFCVNCLFLIPFKIASPKRSLSWRGI